MAGFLVQMTRSWSQHYHGTIWGKTKVCYLCFPPHILENPAGFPQITLQKDHSQPLHYHHSSRPQSVLTRTPANPRVPFFVLLHPLTLSVTKEPAWPGQNVSYVVSLCTELPAVASSHPARQSNPIKQIPCLAWSFAVAPGPAPSSRPPSASLPAPRPPAPSPPPQTSRFIFPWQSSPAMGHPQLSGIFPPNFSCSMIYLFFMLTAYCLFPTWRLWAPQGWRSLC